MDGNELDDLGVPIKKTQQAETDDLGVPKKKYKQSFVIEFGRWYIFIGFKRRKCK